MIFLSEYADQDRIAQVYKRDNSSYCVEIFERLTSLGRVNFKDEESAENYAEDWVQAK
jgi:hypothetical protein